jgi:hypothetical protein
MNSPKPNSKVPADNRPRRAVVLPLVAVCFVVAWLSVRDYFKPSDPPSPPVDRTNVVVNESSTPTAGNKNSGRLPALTPSIQARSPSSAEQAVPASPSDDATFIKEPVSSLPPAELARPAGSLIAVPVRTDTPTAIEGRIRLKGTPAPEKQLPLDASCSQLHVVMPTTHFYAVDAEGGLADVLVSIKEGVSVESFPPPGVQGHDGKFLRIREGVSQPSFSPSIQHVLLDQVGCEFVPYVLGLQTGQKLLVRNSDPFMHNVYVSPTAPGNRASNRAQPAKSKDLEYVFQSPEDFLRIKCDVHIWMFAYVGVFNHPFFAVSGANGGFKLPDVPAGRYTIEAYHRKAGKASREVTVRHGQSVNADFVLEVPATDR